MRSGVGTRAQSPPLGWQPSRFLTDPAEAQRAFALAEQLGSVNAAAQELGTTWLSLRKAFTRHGLGMPARNPQTVRRRAVEAARQRSGQPATPGLDPVFVALNPGALPARARPEAELYQWAATHQQLTSPPPPVEGADGERDWRLDAACANVDPELFFPEPGQVPQAAAAKAVCAGCAVRGSCLQAALHGPQARDDHSGIFAGTTARDRVALRGRASMALGTRFLQDRTAAEEALALANEQSIDRAAQKLGVSKQALRRAFDHHGLPQPQVFQGGPPRTRFYQDRDAAEQAWQRAAEVGINQTRKELGVSDRALRTAWQRHGLGLPPRPTATPTTPRLDPAFLKLNRGLLPARERSVGELAAWVRRDEEYATLGAAVVVELNSESRTRRPTTRAWAIIRRAERGQRRASDREGRSERRQVDRASRTDRPGRARAPVQEREVIADAR